MSNNQNSTKSKISDIAHEITHEGKEYKSKELSEILSAGGFSAKNSAGVVDTDEYSFLLDRLTTENQLEDFDKYMNGEIKIASEKPKAAPAVEKKPEAAPVAPKAEPEVKPEPQAKQEAPAAQQTKPVEAKELPSAAQNHTSAAPTHNNAQPAQNNAAQPQNNAQPAQNSAAQPQNNAQPAQNNAAQSARPQHTQGQRPQNNNFNAHSQQNGGQRQQTNGQQTNFQPRQPQNGNQPRNNNQQRSSQPNAQTQAQGGRNMNQSRPQGQNNNATQSVPAATKPVDNRSAQRNARFEQKPQFNTQKPQKNQKQRPAPQQPQIIRPMPNVPAEADGKVLDSQNRGTRLAGGRVVDTRTTTVDLSKYDERLEKFVPDADKNAAGEKQKLKKQNNRQNDREKERMAMEKLKKQEAAERAKKQQLSITLPETIVVNELAMKLRITVADVVKKLMMLGVMASVNQAIDYDTAALVAMEFGAKVSREVVVTIEEKLFDDSGDDSAALEERAPVVCVMGHVDHGKTSLLDAIRNTHVTTGEAGGITQHIGAYRVHIKGKDITFLDTPGHEAFTAMRARGAQATDIAILVVAADDGIMPQTIEAINHAKAAGVDIIVAINKMDKYGATPDNVMQELTKYELVPEQWGGDVICVPVSALTHMGIDDLLENILLVAEMKELKANPSRRAKGIVIEASLDRGRGPVATVLVQNGTLTNGDVVIAGTAVGRVRAMIDDKGKTIKTAGPSVPVEIVGLSEVPAAGDEFNAVEDERMARELAEQRRAKAKEDEFKANAKVNLDDLFAQISSGQKELNIIVKADVGGSAEAVKQSLVKLSNEEVKVNIIHTGVGGITEGDVMFASASNAIIVGFNVRPDKSAIDTAERQKVDIRTYRIIYECIEEISAAMKGMLAPKFRENVLGHAEVRQTIHVPNVGTIAGSYVQDGKVTRSAQIRVLRDGIVIFEDKISSLRRFKDDVKEVAQGFECGVGLERFNDIKVGDILEAFEMEEIKTE